MRKSELIEQNSKDAGIPKGAATRALNSFLDQIKKALNNKRRQVNFGGVWNLSEGSPRNP